jgi:hypothetical protein
VKETEEKEDVRDIRRREAAMQFIGGVLLFGGCFGSPLWFAFENDFWGYVFGAAIWPGVWFCVQAKKYSG